MSIPKIIHQLWIGTKPAPITLMNTWKEKNPDFEYIFWNEQEFINRKDTYNLSVGGLCLKSTWKKSNETITHKLKNDPVWAETRRHNISLGVRKAMKNGKCSTANREFQMLRNKKSQTEESIKKRKETYAKNKHQQGENHSLYGKKAMYNDVCWKWVHKEEIEKHLDAGWSFGKLKSYKEV